MRNDIDAAVERVLDTGRNAIDLKAQPIEKAWFEGKGTLVHFVVKQDIDKQRAMLVHFSNLFISPDSVA